MPPFVYRCPNTAHRIQGYIAEDVGPDHYEPTLCTMCQKVHLVNPTTGKVLGEDVPGDDDNKD